MPTMSCRLSGLKAEHCLVNTFPPGFLLNRVPDGERIMGTSPLGSRIQGKLLVSRLPRDTSLGTAISTGSWTTHLRRTLAAVLR
jgi:hypothetical protein